MAPAALMDTLQDGDNFIFISASSRDNLDALKSQIIEKVNLEGFRTCDIVVTNLRQKAFTMQERLLRTF